MTIPQLERLCVKEGVTFGTPVAAKKAVEQYVKGRRTHDAIRVAQAVQKYVRSG